MKFNRLICLFLLMLFFVLTPQSMFSQCRFLDQKQEIINSNDAFNSFAQSFTAGMTGNIQTIDLNVAGNGFVIIELFKGDGFQQLLGPPSFIPLFDPVNGWTSFDMLLGYPPLVEGQIYTFRVTVDMGFLRSSYYMPNIYDQGRMWGNGQIINGDLAFRIFMGEPDFERPVANCKNATIYLDNSCQATLPVEAIDNGSSDNCGIKSMRLSKNSFTRLDVGKTLWVTLRVDDYAGNYSSCNAQVTVLDTIKPIAISKPYTLYLDSTGNGRVYPQYVDGGCSDNCMSVYGGNIYLTLDKYDFTCADAGLNLVTLTVKDKSGNSSSCTAEIAVVGAGGEPVARCKNTDVFLDANGVGNITPSDVDGGSTLGCGGVPNLSIDKSTFIASDIGDNIVILTASDASGRSTTCQATVTVHDNIPPNAVCKNISVSLDPLTNQAVIQPEDVDGGSTDNCGIERMTLDRNIFTCTNSGPGEVVLTVYDLEGNNSSCTALVSILDNVPPTITCKSAVVELDQDGLVQIIPEDVLESVDDDCSETTLTVNPNILDCSFASIDPDKVNIPTSVSKGYAGRTITFTDVNLNGNGNKLVVSPGTQITLTLNWNSQFTSTYCPGCIQQYYVGIQNVFDNCIYSGGTSYNISRSSTIQFTAPPIPGVYYVQTGSSLQYHCVPKGYSVLADGAIAALIVAPQVTLTATDINGNSATCKANVFVEDNTPPIVITKNIDVHLNESGFVDITADDVDNGSSDACGILTKNISKRRFYCSDVGSNEIIFTVIDKNRNISTATTNITVIDSTAPTLICKSTVVQLDQDGLAQITPEDVLDSVDDDCYGTTLTINPDILDCSFASIDPDKVNIPTSVSKGYAGRTITFTNVNLNNSGNKLVVSPGTQMTLTLNWNSQYTSTYCPGCIQQYYVGINGIFDNCIFSGGTNYNRSGSKIIQFTAPPNPGVYYIQTGSSLQYHCVPMGYSVLADGAIAALIVAPQVTLTATDRSGNQTSCQANVFVEDNTLPLAIIKNIEVQLNNNGYVDISPGDVDNGSSDACGILSLNISKRRFYCADVGSNEVTFTAIDKNRNISTATAIVTVKDIAPPVVITRNIDISIGHQNEITLQPESFDNGSYDVCGIEKMTIDKSTFNCNDLGENQVNLTVYDLSGNSSTALAILNLHDNTYPIVKVRNFVLNLDANGQANLNTRQIDDGSYDNCSIDSMWLSRTEFSCTDVNRTHPVILYVSDISGNTSSKIAYVTIKDALPPIVKTNPAVIYLDQNGYATLSPEMIDEGSTDNCSINSMWVNQSTFDCYYANKSIPVLLYAKDNSGNTSAAPATIYIRDSIRPVVKTKPATIYLDQNGRAILNTWDVNNYSYDNCSIQYLWLDKRSFDCNSLNQTVTVYLYARDLSGNVSYSSVNVTIRDAMRPVARTRNATVYLDENGHVTVQPSQINYASYDNCSIESMWVEPSEFDCAYVNTTNLVYLYVKDKGGNTSSAPSYVTIKDYIRPVVQTKPADIFLDENGLAVVTPEQIDNGSYDNCGIVTKRVYSPTFNCSYVNRTYSVHLYAQDQSGNYSIGTSYVTIKDNLKPVVKTKPATIYLDHNGVALLYLSQINNGSYDNCGITSMWISQSTFDCNQAGKTVDVLLYAKDQSGNISYKNASVTVLDNLPPRIYFRNISVQLNENGFASITVNDIDNGSNDNCGISSRILSKTQFTCEDFGYNTISYTVFDNSGNQSSVFVNVNVLDDSPPTAICRNLVIHLDENGYASIDAEDINNGSYDNCGIAELSINQYEFDCSNFGSNDVILTVTDVHGNSSECKSQVIVLDDIPPTVITQNVVVELNENGEGSITAEQIDNGSFDNCAIQSLSLNQYDFNCTYLGDNTVALTVTDVNGNVSMATAIVTVVDLIYPTISVTVNPNVLWPPNNQMQTITANVIYDDNCDVTVALISIECIDENCSSDIENADYNTDDFSFDLRRKKRIPANQDRIYNILYRATDESGNSTDADATVVVPSSMAKEVVFDDNITVFDGSDGTTLSVFPNPTTGEVNVDFASNSKGDLSLKLMNITGNELMKFKQYIIKDYTNVIDLSDLPSGTYLLEVNFEMQSKVVKIIKF